MKFEEYLIDDIIHENVDVYTLRVKPKKKKKITPFVPGQFYHIKNPHFHRPLETRAFSIITSPSNTTHLEFIIKSYGPWTQKLRQKKSGESLWLFGPFGGFTLHSSIENLVFIAGGVGITPFLSMLQTLHEQKNTKSVTLLYANKSAEKIIKKQHLDSLFLKNKSWKLKFLVTNTIQFADEQSGYITDELLKKEIDFTKDPTFFICGSQRFTQNVVMLLESLGVEDSRIKQEIFIPPNFSNLENTPLTL